jgi:FkbM family methyltransferase
MSFATVARRLGNQLYKVAFPLYGPLYSAFKSYADRAERELLGRSLTPGSIVVDAGANIGVYSRFLSKCVGPTGVVHSFEPSPENFARLQDSLLEFPNIRLNQLAVSDKTGESLLYISDVLNVDHRAYPTVGETRQTVCIRSTALDDYFRPGERVDVIKLDIQGYELHAVRGAQRVLDDNPNIRLLFEVWPYGLKLAGSSAEGLLLFLRARGFSIFLLHGESLIPYDNFPIKEDANTYFNLFATRSDVRCASSTE